MIDLAALKYTSYYRYVTIKMIKVLPGWKFAGSRLIKPLQRMQAKI